MFSFYTILTPGKDRAGSQRPGGRGAGDWTPSDDSCYRRLSRLPEQECAVQEPQQPAGAWQRQKLQVRREASVEVTQGIYFMERP